MSSEDPRSLARCIGVIFRSSESKATRHRVNVELQTPEPAVRTEVWSFAFRRSGEREDYSPRERGATHAEPAVLARRNGT
jgi:hypothetical protein